MEIVQYILGSFWRFCGFTTILYVTLHYFVNGIVESIKAFKR